MSFILSMVAFVPSSGVAPSGPVILSGSFHLPIDAVNGYRYGMSPQWSKCRWVMKMSLIDCGGFCMAIAFLTLPGPRSKKNVSPFPSSTMIDVAAWSRRGGHGHDPRYEMRISFGPTSSSPGAKIWLFLTYGVGLKYGGRVTPEPPVPP